MVMKLATGFRVMRCSTNYDSQESSQNLGRTCLKTRRSFESPAVEVNEEPICQDDCECGHWWWKEVRVVGRFLSGR